MDLNLGQILSDVLTMGIGSIGTWLLWITRNQLKSKTDLNAAFTKIRQLEDKLNGRIPRDHSQDKYGPSDEGSD